jgi:hypothetical protein
MKHYGYAATNLIHCIAFLNDIYCKILFRNNRLNYTMRIFLFTNEDNPMSLNKNERD